MSTKSEAKVYNLILLAKKKSASPAVLAQPCLFLDFMMARTHDGKAFWLLTIIHEYTGNAWPSRWPTKNNQGRRQQKYFS